MRGGREKRAEKDLMRRVVVGTVVEELEGIQSPCSNVSRNEETAVWRAGEARFVHEQICLVVGQQGP